MDDTQIIDDFNTILATRPQVLPANVIARKSPYKRRHADYLRDMVQVHTEYEIARESEDKHDERF